MARTHYRIAVGLLCLLAATTTVHGAAPAEPAALTAQVDKLFAAYAKPDSPGCALAIIKDGAVVYQHGYGIANLELGVPIAPSTVFQIGSVSKQFTAWAIFLLAQEGKLGLDDDVRKYLPELPNFGKVITVRHLIHHTSGLREMTGLLMMAGWRMEDHMSERDILDLVWRQKELNFEPGKEYLYCNTGYLLLGQIVQRASGQSLRHYTQDKIFKPLGMTSTHFHDNHRMLVKNHADSYRPGADGFQRVALSSDFAGPTNLFTTVEDLARWDQNFYDPKVGGPAVIAEMYKTGKLTSGRELDYAGGLRITTYRGLKLVEHSGVDAGYRAALLRFPEQRFSVIVLGNVSSFVSTGQARAVADLYLADKLQLVPAPKKPEAPPEKGAKGEQGQQAAPEEKKAPAEAPLTPEQLAAYTGEFLSEELGVIYRVRVHDGKLVVRHLRGEDALKPTGADAFTTALGRLTFTHNADKQINGFLASNGRIRNLRFVKVEVRPVK
jgi:CubicO group peptidase (beta-lactamase class C family)